MRAQVADLVALDDIALAVADRRQAEDLDPGGVELAGSGDRRLPIVEAVGNNPADTGLSIDEIPPHRVTIRG